MAQAALGSTELLELDAEADRYGGVRVLREHLPNSNEHFESRLDHSLSTWKARGIRGVWIEIPTERAELVPIAIRRGFAPHHAESTHFFLNKWLPEQEECTFPPNASHQVGVGAVVADGKRMVIVKENRGPTGRWKIPTGLSECEDITEAAKREVLEETGLKTTFEATVALRQAHGVAFGKSDLFFLCVLRLADDESGDLHVSGKGELQEAKWEEIEQFEKELARLYPEGSVWHELNQRAIDYVLQRNCQTALCHRTLPLMIRSGHNLCIWAPSDRDRA